MPDQVDVAQAVSMCPLARVFTGSDASGCQMSKREQPGFGSLQRSMALALHLVPLQRAERRWDALVEAMEAVGAYQR